MSTKAGARTFHFLLLGQKNYWIICFLIVFVKFLKTIEFKALRE
jgi:hypothetical protein